MFAAMTRRHRVLGELVTFADASRFHHDGILYFAGKDRPTIVHVHGSFGNFYQNEFVRIMALTYLHAEINFLSFNLTSHDGLAEGYRNECDFEYAGGAVSPFDWCVEDIQAAIDFVAPFSSRIVLQGHSLGCDRVLHYLLSKSATHDFVLLSPCDSYRLQANWISPETVEKQIERLAAASTTDQFDWLPLMEYGVRRADWEYAIPIARRSLLSILQGPAFHLIRLDQPSDFTLNQSALLYIGGNDALLIGTREEMERYFRDRVKHLTMTSFYAEGDHSLSNCEYQISYEIAAWVKR